MEVAGAVSPRGAERRTAIAAAQGGRLLALRQLGQSAWLDNLSRALLEDGELDRLIAQGVSGITSNPAIFHKAISTQPHYREDLERLRRLPLDAERRYESLVIADVQSACERLGPTFERSAGDDGYVSLEVSPALAYRVNETVRAARRLRDAVARPNLLVKVPATPPGVAAFEELLAQGINVNVTLMFSLAHAREVQEAYMRGARRWLDRGGDGRSFKCVASLFLSRIDTSTDRRLEESGTDEALALRGFAGVAVAKLAYRRWRETFHGRAFASLLDAGVRPPCLLWASTGTKDARYSDVMYVEPLIGPETINTMPDATLAAFCDHGVVAATLEQGTVEASAHCDALASFGIDLHAAGDLLQSQGVASFDEAYRRILELMA